MKRFLILLSILFCNTVCADTINLHWLNADGTVYQNSTCTVDGDLNIPSTPPTKYGYTFTGWKMANYIPIEYLESTGTQYIDTGVIRTLQYDYKIITQISYSETNTRQLNGVGGYTYFGVVNGYCQVSRQGNDHQNITATPKQFIKFEIDYNCPGNKVTFSINESQKYQENVQYMNNPANSPFYLFKMSPDAYHSSQKLAYFKLYKDDTLVRDFIPVLDGNGTPCMYDRVEQKFYYNQGTGQFIAGPVLQ